MQSTIEDLASELTDGPTWITGRWLKRLLAAVLHDRVLAGDNVEEIPTESGRRFNAQAGGGEANEQPIIWSPYLSPTATGPNAPLTVRIIPGDVTDGASVWTPARENIELVVPRNSKLYVWLEAGIDEDAHITDLDYAYAATLPGPVEIPDYGTPPSLSRKLLFIVASTDTAVDLPPIAQLCKSSMTLYKQTVGDQSVMLWQPLTAIPGA